MFQPFARTYIHIFDEAQNVPTFTAKPRHIHQVIPIVHAPLYHTVNLDGMKASTFRAFNPTHDIPIQ
jgi:hypothetical protein